jgi:hypothetical protein
MDLTAIAVGFSATCALYLALSFLGCALHVRLVPGGHHSRIFRKFPSLALVYPFFLLVIVGKAFVRLFIVHTANLFIRMFEIASGQRVYRRNSVYSHGPRPERQSRFR